MYLYLWVRVPEDNQTCAGFLYASEELRKHQLSVGLGIIFTVQNQNKITRHMHMQIYLLIRGSAEVPGLNDFHVPQLKVLSPFHYTAWFTPQEMQWNFPSEPLGVTPSVCACLSANASSFLKLGPPVGLQTLLTAHSYASFLPNSTSTGTREKPEVSTHYIFWCFEISEEGS